jgi:hypothetical protein
MLRPSLAGHLRALTTRVQVLVALLVEIAAAVLFWVSRVPEPPATTLSILSGVLAYWYLGALQQGQILWRHCMYCGRRIWLWWRAIEDRGWFHRHCYQLALSERVRLNRLR